MAPNVYPRFIYKLFVIDKADKGMDSIVGQFIRASDQIITKREKYRYRLVKSNDRNRLFNNFGINELITNKPGYFIYHGSWLLIPERYLSQQVIPDEIPAEF